MIFPDAYSCLKQNSFRSGDFELKPIRYEDRMQIMKWRNEQMYHLRQSEPLTSDGQDKYFKTTVAQLFSLKQPGQLLFSLLRNDKLIGYGGLVHINWIDNNAEISFIMDTDLEASEFDSIWSNYLQLIEEVAFTRFKLKKIFVYAFDLRPHLYDTLKKNGFFEDARLKDHCRFNNEYKDVVIHSKLRVTE